MSQNVTTKNYVSQVCHELSQQYQLRKAVILTKTKIIEKRIDEVYKEIFYLHPDKKLDQIKMMKILIEIKEHIESLKNYTEER